MQRDKPRRLGNEVRAREWKASEKPEPSSEHFR